MWEPVGMMVVMAALWIAGMAFLGWMVKSITESLVTGFQRVLSPGVEPELPLTPAETRQMEMTTELPWDLWDAEAETPPTDPFPSG